MNQQNTLKVSTPAEGAYSCQALGIKAGSVIRMPWLVREGHRKVTKVVKFNVRAVVDDEFIVARRWYGFGGWRYQMIGVYAVWIRLRYPVNVNGQKLFTVIE